MIAGLSFRITLIFTATGCATTFTTSTVRAAPGDIYNLGSLPDDGGETTAFAINEAGQVAGWGVSGSDKHAFRYDWTSPGVGVMQDLGTLGGRVCKAFAINDAGQVVGYSESHYGDHGFLYTGTPGAGGSMTDLGGGAYALGISNRGETVGKLVQPHAGTTGFIYDAASGQLQQFAVPATAVNDRGQIVGQHYRYDPDPTGTGGTIRDIGGFNATAINDSGQVVGDFWNADNKRHAFRYTGTPGQDGSLQDLGTVGDQPYSYAFGINDAGFVAGYGTGTSNAGGLVAAIWTPDGTAINLDAWSDSVNPDDGAHWKLIEARDINDSGFIAGNGWYYDDVGLHFRAFVLDASSLVPEPGTVSLVLLLPIVVSPRRQRRPV